jgi:hypothetical protein
MHDEENNLACKQTKMLKDERICTKMPQDNERGALQRQRLIAFDTPRSQKIPTTGRLPLQQYPSSRLGQEQATYAILQKRFQKGTSLFDTKMPETDA